MHLLLAARQNWWYHSRYGIIMYKTQENMYNVVYKYNGIPTSIRASERVRNAYVYSFYTR